MPRQLPPIASSTVTLGSALAFVLAATVLSLVSDDSSLPHAPLLRGTLDAGSPLPAGAKPV